MKNIAYRSNKGNFKALDNVLGEIRAGIIKQHVTIDVQNITIDVVMLEKSIQKYSQ